MNDVDNPSEWLAAQRVHDLYREVEVILHVGDIY